MKAVFVYTFFIIAIAFQINIAQLGLLIPIYIAVAASISSILPFPIFAFTTVIMSMIYDLISCGNDYSATFASIPFIVSMIFFENWRQHRKESLLSQFTLISIPFAIFNLFFTCSVLYFHSPPFLKIIFSFVLNIVFCLIFFASTEAAKRILYIRESERMVFG